MTDFAPQSTDQTPGSTNRLNHFEIQRGHLTVTPVAQSTGFIGSNSISISKLNSQTILPELEVSMDISGAGVTAYRKCPFNLVDTNGNVSESMSYYVNQNVPKGSPLEVQLVIQYYNRTASTGRTFYWKCMNTEAGSTTPGTFGASGGGW